LARSSRKAPAQKLTLSALNDHVPRLLEALAKAVARHDESAKPLADLPEQHAAVRFKAGYDLRDVIAEYRLLREVVMELYGGQSDISPESRRTLEPLTVMNEAVDRAISAAVDQHVTETDRVRETFIAMLGHDLRDPLHTMLFSADTLTRSAADPTTAHTARRIVRSAERMDRMIRDLLDFARGRLGRGLTITPVRLDARALIARTTLDIAQAHPDRNIAFGGGDGPGDGHVEWDGDRVVQLITNLVNNALVHGADPITVASIEQDDRLTIQVVNTGEIPSDLLPRLFDPFVERRKSPTGGLGLGLYYRPTDRHRTRRNCLRGIVQWCHQCQRHIAAPRTTDLSVRDRTVTTRTPRLWKRPGLISCCPRPSARE
jgi:signal transduction histidine kinase